MARKKELSNSLRTRRIVILLTPETYAELEKAARADDRSISAYVERLIKKDVEK
jgi:hypothetical protein